MQTTDYYGTIGVSLILLAFWLLSIGKVSAKSNVYLLLNAIGALLACYASILLYYWPFIILEGIWALIAFKTLLRK
jgi:hypothetical protein